MKSKYSFVWCLDFMQRISRICLLLLLTSGTQQKLQKKIHFSFPISMLIDVVMSQWYVLLFLVGLHNVGTSAPRPATQSDCERVCERRFAHTFTFQPCTLRTVKSEPRTASEHTVLLSGDCGAQQGRLHANSLQIPQYLWKGLFFRTQVILLKHTT